MLFYWNGKCISPQNIHKGFIVFRGRGQELVSYITVELAKEEGGGGRQVECRHGINSGETYRAWLIEQHLVRVNEKLC